MTPGPAKQAYPPSVADGRVPRRIVMALYLVSSAAAAVLASRIGRELAWIPDWPVSSYLAWAANIAIGAAAVVLAYTHAPPRLQLAMAFAAPGLYVALLSALGAASGGSPTDRHVVIISLSFAWMLYAEFFGSVFAFAIALASHQAGSQPGSVARPAGGSGVVLRSFRALGWIVAAAWLYMHGFGWAVDHWADSRLYLDGLPMRFFEAAATVAWSASPLWLVGATALVVSSCWRKRRPALADAAALMLVLFLIGLYFFLGFQD